MWADAQRDVRPAEYRWRPLFNGAKFFHGSLCTAQKSTNESRVQYSPQPARGWVSRHQKGKTILNFNEARNEVALASAGPYANHLHLA